MSIKDLIVFLDDSASNNERVECAFHLAKTHNATLTGVALASLKPMHAKSDDENAIVRMADKLAHQLVDEFTQAASDADLEVMTIVISGDEATSAMKMAHYSRNTDLVILGQPDPSLDSYLRLQDFVQKVMLHSGRPILFTPYIGIKKLPFQKALIAWDGTPAASRAVHDAIPLLREMDVVDILIVESKKQQEIKRELLEEGLVRHLSNHGVNARTMRLSPGKSNVATVILNQISENDIDLLVIGGYGTPTIKQKIFGGVSRTLLSSMVVPVLMSH